MPSNIEAVDKCVTLTWAGNNINEFFKFGKCPELMVQCLYRVNIHIHNSFCDGLYYRVVQVNPDIQL